MLIGSRTLLARVVVRSGGGWGRSLRVGRAGAGARCRRRAGRYLLHTNVVWYESDQSLAVFDLVAGQVNTCATQRVASHVSRVDLMNEEGFVWQGETITGREGTIRYARFENGRLPGRSTVVDTQASVNYAIVAPPVAILYTVNATGARDGLYISDQLPFSAPMSLP